MPFLIIIFLIAACLPVRWPEPIFGPDPFLAGLSTLLTVLLLVFAAALNSDRAVLFLMKRPDCRSSIGRRNAYGRHILFFANLAGFAFAMVGLGWGWLIQNHCYLVNAQGQGRLCPGVELLITAPYFFTILGNWLVSYDADRAFYDSSLRSQEEGARFWSRAGYVFYHLRQSVLMVFLPILFMAVQQGMVRAFPDTMDASQTNLLSFAFFPLVILFLPLSLPYWLGLKPLPPGPSSDRLHARAHRMGLRYRDILIWNTQGMTANALVVGLIPQVRYILFTDRLLRDLNMDEVDAVLGHECGHAKHYHLPLYAIFLLATLLFVGALTEVIRLQIPVWSEQHPNWFMMLSVAFVGAYLFVVFGFLSRRCERQADVYGCRAVSCGNPHCSGHDPNLVLDTLQKRICPGGIQIFVSALQRVADLNGMQSRVPSWSSYSWSTKPLWLFESFIVLLGAWQHSTIDHRIDYLESLISRPEAEPRFQRRVRWLQLGMILFPITGLVVLGSIFGWKLLLSDIPSPSLN